LKKAQKTEAESLHYNMNRRIEILKRNIFKPQKLINHLGNKLINPILGERMVFQPSYIDVEPVSKCNLACVFCPVSGWKRAQLENLSFEDFKKILKQLPFLIEIKLQGMGEPFLNSDIFKMIEYGNKKGILMNTYTNGTILNKEKIAKLFCSPLFLLSFSLDTPDKKTYQKIRGRDMFDVVIGNIKLAVEEKRLSKSNTIIQIWCVANKDNLKDIPELVKLSKEMGVDRLVIQTKLNSWNLGSIKKRFKDIEENIFEEKNMAVLNGASKLAESIGLNFCINTENYFSKDKPCNIPKMSAYIAVEGKITPCCVNPDPQVMSMGNIYKENFMSIWNSKKYRQLRRSIKNDNLPYFCKECYKAKNGR